MFDLDHIEKQLVKHIEEAKHQHGKLQKSEDGCKTLRKTSNRIGVTKAEKEKEWAGIDGKVSSIERNIKKIQNQELIRCTEAIDENQRGLTNLNTEIASIQVRTSKSLKRIRTAFNSQGTSEGRPFGPY